MNAKLDGEFQEFMHARWAAMVRLAYGLTGDQKVFAFAARPGAKPIRWVAYGSAGNVVASSGQ